MTFEAITTAVGNLGTVLTTLVKVSPLGFSG